jgi:hypothetical protein
MEVAKKPREEKCPGRATDCTHYRKVDGVCKRRRYAGREPGPWPCASYVRVVKD